MLNTGKLAGKTIYITGASRGIGKSIALKAAQDGAKIVVAAKTGEAHPKLPGTIFTAAEESSLSATTAFMTGKLKIDGNMGKAMKLESVMKKMHSSRGYHTLAAPKSSFDSSLRHQKNAFHKILQGTYYSTATFSDVPQIFKRIGEITNADMVKKVNATYMFEIAEVGNFHIDLKEGEGKVGEGDFVGKPEGFKPDVVFKLNGETTLKLFNREMPAATAFMSGKLKLSGDLTKAMALETVFKASADSRKFHTSAAQLSSLYSSVTEVRERIKSVTSKKIVDQVGAVYLFDVQDEGKFFVDLKNDNGKVGEGDPPTELKPDVTIKMNSEVFLKIFNRELQPSAAFMTGKVKISGDLTKALTLEKIMKAAREAEDSKKNKK